MEDQAEELYFLAWKRENLKKDSILLNIKKQDPEVYLHWEIASAAMDYKTQYHLEDSCPIFAEFRAWEEAWHNSPEYKSRMNFASNNTLRDSAKAEHDRKLELVYDAVKYNPNNLCRQQ